MAKYSYIPTSKYQGKSTVVDCVDRGYGYFIDSDLRVLEFRNQSKERFIFCSVSRLRVIIFGVMILGIFAGYWLAR